MLIRSYGEFWNPDLVDWGTPGAGHSGKFIGLVNQHPKKALKKIPTGTGSDKKSKTVQINFWDAKGIYVLYSEFQPIYDGKAFNTSIGVIIRSHLTDRLAGK